jgi:Tfp pilus assembly protein PilV
MKIKNKRGETLLEVLVALLIIVLVMAMLPSAITLAAKFNKQAEDRDISTMMDRSTSIPGAEVTVKYGEKSFSVPVNAYESKGYCFYDNK